MNTQDQLFLQSIGVKKENIYVAYAGADEKKFFYTKRNDKTVKTVGFCLRYENFDGYAPRKNYDFLFDLIQKLSSYEIILVGKNWQNSPYLSRLKSLGNFTYVDVEYDEYPKYYNKMDIFCSVSTLEGGPLSLLEAMFCNVIPVVSSVGFAPDLIVNGKNGFLFNQNATTDDVVKLIDTALQNINSVVVSKSVESLSWSKFGENIIQQMSV
jgi:glycosyltransferase involved in cell wall biosynthesis